MFANEVETSIWKKSPSIKKSNSPTLPRWSDLTSFEASRPATFAQTSSTDSSPRSKLEIRTRGVTPPLHLNHARPQITSSQSLPVAATQPLVSSNTPPGAKPFRPTPSRKRHFVEIIDLTIEDDYFEPSERKKSRSSSHSTETSIEARTGQPEIVKRPSSISVLKLQNTRTKEGNPQPHSSTPGVFFRKSIPAVIVPPPQPSPQECRRIFIRNLSVIDDVSVENTVDDTSPPLDFQFVTENVLRDGVEQASEDFMVGCKCRKENGRHMGCEYLNCECLDDSVNSKGKKQFPYSQAKKSTACLRDAFLNGRNHIYECNSRCNCGSNCKNRVVQHGRKVGLEIFKTINRGWGLRCTEDLKRGQYIDNYRGEIITHEEANRRGETRTLDQEIYFMSLDKWTEEDGGSKYVCDGMHLGGPTRFVNHSCDPNCAIYTVSYNHADTNIYDLAFFATEMIPAGTELTFNYVDDDRTDIITEEKADEMQKENGYRPAKCLCGSSRCRGYFFT